MDDGGVEYAGRNLCVVFEGLLGTEEKKEKLRNFLDLPYTLSAIRFAAESRL